MPGELLQLGVQLRIKPVGLNHARLQVVDHHRRRHSAKVAECILQAADETLAGLPPHRLGVTLREWLNTRADASKCPGV